jgi:2-keto-4-pentenoate hydratase/2-oxohepta-3-ene-1,7-dioic acid hydratase in catechol pathway
MKLVTFRKGRAQARAGALVDDGRTVVDLQVAHRGKHGKSSKLLTSVLSIIEGGDDALALARSVCTDVPQDNAARLDASKVKLLAPVPQPPQLRDFLCFETHLVQAFAATRRVRAQESPDPAAALAEMEAKGMFAVPKVWYERPLFYHPNRLTVCGNDVDVPWPEYSNALDFELEFGCYIGKAGKDIARDAARPHIFGYTIYNDFSARDEQGKDMAGQLGPGKGKDFDNSNSMGPCLVTADEIPDPYNLTMVVRVNGEEWGRGNSGTMHWKFEDCIAHISRSETLHPGEFLGSGTVGNGCGLEHMRFLKPGDTIELEVERIGVLRNRVVRKRARS